ncbi:MAG: RcnB family protein [Sphingomonadales bacterium]|nr:RcnB family protein [Sphingomonadales bacterium]MDE2568162.1 RcnB family protein [Sphingomonadales bacterium]
MRKLLMAAMAASMLVPVAASAQGPGEARHDQRDYRHDRNEARRDTHDRRVAEARRDRRDARDDRRDRREDWRDYRDSHRDVYRRPDYRGPRGYRYRPVAVGYRFAPPYYAREYWLPDYTRYRLPPPGYGHRWVRYGNDVVLINIRNGTVLQVFASFFF